MKHSKRKVKTPLDINDTVRISTELKALFKAECSKFNLNKSLVYRLGACMFLLDLNIKSATDARDKATAAGVSPNKRRAYLRLADLRVSEGWKFQDEIRADLLKLERRPKNGKIIDFKMPEVPAASNGAKVPAAL